MQTAAVAEVDTSAEAVRAMAEDILRMHASE